MNLDRQLRIAVYLLMALFSISLTMISPMLPVIVRQFNITAAQGGLLITFQSIGGLLITILMAFIADKYNKALLIVIGFFIFVVSLFSISFAAVYSTLLFLFFLYGLGSKVPDNLNNSFLAEQFPDNRAVYLNILHAVFGIGALIGPLMASILMEQGLNWGLIFRLMAVLSLLGLLYFVILVKKNKKVSIVDSQNQKQVNFNIILKNKRMWFILIIMLLYVGNQASLTTWLPMYMETHLRASPVTAGLSLSMFWIGIILSRFLTTQFTRSYSNIFLIKWGNFTGGIILLLSVFLQLQWLILFNFVLVGLFTGATFPLVVDSASKIFPDYTGTVTSIIFIIVNLSLMFFPWFIGYLSDLYDFQIAFIFAGIILLLVFLLTFLIKPEKKKCVK